MANTSQSGDKCSAIARDTVYRRAGGKCQCSGQNCPTRHRPGERCNADLTGGWECHNADRSKPHSAASCRALCVPCHEQTPSYGQPKPKP